MSENKTSLIGKPELVNPALIDIISQINNYYSLDHVTYSHDGNIQGSDYGEALDLLCENKIEVMNIVFVKGDKLVSILYNNWRLNNELRKSIIEQMMDSLDDCFEPDVYVKGVLQPKVNNDSARHYRNEIKKYEKLDGTADAEFLVTA